MENHENISQLAEQLAAAAAWLNQPAARVALVCAGISLLIWKLPWFCRFRQKLMFSGRRVLSDKVWINQQAAIVLIDNSEWANMKRPRRGGLAVALDVAELIGQGESKFSKLGRKFNLYLQRTLESFATDNPGSVQDSENGKSYEEGALREFLDNALDGELSGINVQTKR